ncbi:unnamed protein product [Camellia sinensis]
MGLIRIFFIMIFLRLHVSSSPSQNLLVSAFNQLENGNKAALDKVPIKVGSIGRVTTVDRRGGGGHGGGGGHAASGGGSHGGGGGGRGRGGSNNNRGNGVGRGYAAVIPLYAAGAGAHHINNNHRHGGRTSGATTNSIGRGEEDYEAKQKLSEVKAAVVGIARMRHQWKCPTGESADTLIITMPLDKVIIRQFRSHADCSLYSRILLQRPPKICTAKEVPETSERERGRVRVLGI